MNKNEKRLTIFGLVWFLIGLFFALYGSMVALVGFFEPDLPKLMVGLLIGGLGTTIMNAVAGKL